MFGSCYVPGPVQHVYIGSYSVQLSLFQCVTSGGYNQNTTYVYLASHLSLFHSPPRPPPLSPPSPLLYPALSLSIGLSIDRQRCITCCMKDPPPPPSLSVHLFICRETELHCMRDSSPLPTHPSLALSGKPTPCQSEFHIKVKHLLLLLLKS